MPEVDPVFETSFQNMIDHEYSGKDRATKEFPDGNFGITPGSIPPRWTPQQLFAELVREYTRMIEVRRAVWSQTFDQAIGIIQATVNTYTALVGQIIAKKYDNTTAEWDVFMENVRNW